MKIIWEVDDGYVGGSRPHSTEIDENEIRDYETIDEAIEFIEEMIREDYDINITWYMKNREKVVEKVKEILENKEEED